MRLVWNQITIFSFCLQVIQDLWGLLQHGGEATLSVDSFTKQFVELKTSLTHSSGYSPNLLKALNNFGKTAIASPAQGSNTVVPPTGCKTGMLNYSWHSQLPFFEIGIPSKWLSLTLWHENNAQWKKVSHSSLEYRSWDLSGQIWVDIF